MTVVTAHDQGASACISCLLNFIHMLYQMTESQHEIRCDVMVEKIARLDVVTRTKYLYYLDDAFQVLSLTAFDEKGMPYQRAHVTLTISIIRQSILNAQWDSVCVERGQCHPQPERRVGPNVHPAPCSLLQQHIHGI